MEDNGSMLSLLLVIDDLEWLLAALFGVVYMYVCVCIDCVDLIHLVYEQNT